MLAVVMRSFGPEAVLEVEEVDRPSPGRGEALVRVAAVAVSRTRDVATRSGTHPFSRQLTLPHVLGGEFAGVVVAVGDHHDGALVGKRVAAANSHGCGHCPACSAGRPQQCPQLSMLGIHRTGSYAEYVALPASDVSAIPDDVPFADAAAMAATGPIALAQLEVGRVQPGSWLGVSGATGALGSTLLALGGHLGSRLVALSRRPELVVSVPGLEASLDAVDDELPEVIGSLTDGLGLGTVIDNVASPELFARYFACLAIGASIVISGALDGGGAPTLPVPASRLYLRSVSLHGLRTASPDQAARFWELAAAGFRLAPGLVREFALEHAAAAHAHVASGAATGHTVLTRTTAS